MRRHLRDEDLGALQRAGQVAPGAAAHLRRCLRCRQRATDQRAVRHALSTLPPPVLPAGMVEGIAARVRRGDPGTRRTRRVEPRHLGIAAGLAVTAGAVSVVVHGSHGNGTTRVNGLGPPPGVASTASGSAPLVAPAPTARSRRPGPTVASSTDLLAVSRGRDYHHATLYQGAADLLAQLAHPSTPTEVTSASTASYLPTRACLTALSSQLSTSASTLSLVAVEAARYDTRPVTVMVLLGGTASDRGVVLAVAGRCTESSPVVLDQVVLTR